MTAKDTSSSIWNLSKVVKSEIFYFSVSSLIKSEKIVLLAQSWKNAFPHGLIRHERVDED